MTRSAQRCRVLGTGTLAETIERAVRTTAEEPTALVTATDAWDLSAHAEQHAAAAEAGVAWLPVHTELGAVLIGPHYRPGDAGCPHCVQLRRRRTREDPVATDAVRTQYEAALRERPSAWLTPQAADTVAALVLAELRDPRPHTILKLDLNELTVSRHRFLPEPTCPRCGDLPADDASLARIELQPAAKLDADTYRTRDVLGELDELKDTYVDAETGLIRSIIRDTQAGLVVAASLMRLRSHEERVEPGIGRTRSYRSSELIGLLEALERYGGVEPGGKRTVVRGSYAELAADALDPRAFGLHPAQSYATPGFPYREFTEDAVCDWVWGYSFGRAAPVLVPQTLAYYHTRHTEKSFCYEISNGCSLGSGLAEAILHGILEVAERDAFLLTWYSGLAMPRIELASATDAAVPLQAAAITAQTGFTAHVFDTTLEHGVPSVWAVAVNPSGNGPAGVCAAGSSLDPQRAVLNALSELGPIVHDLINRWPDEAEAAAAMVADPNAVRTMQDHSTLYAHPDAFRRLDFLTGTSETTTLAPTDAAFRHADLADDLREVIARFAAAGMDIVVIDQSTPEHRAGGFACVKVLAPGALPMTFGYRNRRIDGLPRLYTVPTLLGHRDRDLRHDELNPHPHPFP